MAASGVNGRRLELSTRDRRTIELRQHFVLPHSTDAELAYETRVWFYFPRGFGISQQTWTPEEFYRDANVYMRLHAPGLSLKDFANLEHTHNPAAILRRQLPKLIEEGAPTGESLDILAKTLGAEFADAVTTAVRGLVGAINRADANDDLSAILADVRACCVDVQRALGAVRRLRAKARAYRSVAAPTLLPSLSFAEEYASAVVDERLAELARVIDTAVVLRDGKGTALSMRLAVAEAAEAVHRRRREQGFPTPTGTAHTSAEHFTYRLGVLKKEMQRALYVDARAGRIDPFFRNSAAMVAAGLAATWATLAQVPLLQGGLSGSQSTLLFSAAVGAYVLKDRIKEWSRVVLTKKLLPWDHNDRIVGDALACAGLGRLVGRASEQVRWVKDDVIPASVDELRKRQRTVRGVAELEHVLCYRRRVAFDGGDEPVPEGFGVQELVRLSLDEVLKRLDDPIDEVSFYDPVTGAFERTGMPKVYHLNVVVETIAPDNETRLSRFRVIVNQHGVVRIDTVADRVAPTSAAASAAAASSMANTSSTTMQVLKVVPGAASAASQSHPGGPSLVEPAVAD